MSGSSRCRSVFVGVVMALLLAACGGGSAFQTAPDSSPGSSSVPGPTSGDGDTTVPVPGGGAPARAEISSISVTDGIEQPLVIEIEPGAHGVASIEVGGDEGVDRMVVRAADGAPTWVTAADDRVALEQPGVGAATIDLDGPEATISWVTADGEVGSSIVPLDLAGSAAPSPGAVTVSAHQQARQASFQGGPVEGRVSGAATVRYRVESEIPTTLDLRVPECGAPFTIGDIEVSCTGNGFATGSRGRFQIGFSAVVPVTSIPLSSLQGEEAAAFLRACEDELGNVSGGFGALATLAGIIGLATTPIDLPLKIAAMIAAAGVGADVVSRASAPASAAEECARRLVVRSYDDAAAERVRSLVVAGLTVTATPVLAGVVVEPTTVQLSPVTPFDGSRPVVETGVLRVTAEPPEQPEAPEEPAEVPAEDPLIVGFFAGDIPLSEATTDGSLAIDGRASIDVTYDENMVASFGGSVQGGAAWDVDFLCYFDAANLAEPTGDVARVRYVLSHGAGFTGTAQAAADGSFTTTVQFPLAYDVSFALTQAFTAECADLNGNPAPGIGSETVTADLTVTVRAGGRVDLATEWLGPEVVESPGVFAGNARTVLGEGRARGTFTTE